MNQFGSFLVLIGVTALALAAVGGLVAWHNEEGRRVRRGLRRVLKSDLHALIVAQGRGRGAGFDFASNTMAVAWDAGEWCLIYRIDELLGVDLIIDGQVAARAFRGEPRRPLDILGGGEKQVTLRLIFDDAQHADFLLELWSAGRPRRRGEPDAAEAVEEGNRWIARIESIFRRKPSPLAATRPRPTPAPQARPAEPLATPAFSALAVDPPPTDGRQNLPFADDDGADDEPLMRRTST
jgi:hypothetical protein